MWTWWKTVRIRQATSRHKVRYPLRICLSVFLKQSDLSSNSSEMFFNCRQIVLKLLGCHFKLAVFMGLNSWPDFVAISRDTNRQAWLYSNIWFMRKILHLLILKLMFSLLDCMRKLNHQFKITMLFKGWSYG